jgi:hypothetical protein
MTKHYFEAAKRISDISNLYPDSPELIEELKKGEQKILELAAKKQQNQK